MEALNSILIVFLIFIRVVSFFVATGFLSFISIPIQVRVLMSVGVSLFVYHSSSYRFDAKLSEQDIFIGVLWEGILGLAMGFITRVFIFVVQSMSEIIGFSSGLSSASIYNSELGQNGSIFQTFFSGLAVLLFFSFHGHLMVLAELSESFTVIPLGGMGLKEFHWSSWVQFLVYPVVTGVRLAMPVLGAIFLANLVMSFMARIVPQINVFLTSLQVTFLVSLVILLLSLPGISESILEVIGDSIKFLKDWV